ncbi:HotDog domain-containing protein [Aspergillus cavernicola]|uniref:HotDog domain-containing protein n=1 Tax=Aspergillus cavernicola TaxID=176166 RepID=A0ABR4J3I1_9EURO
MALQIPGLILPHRPLTNFEKRISNFAERLVNRDGEESWDINTKSLNLTLESATPSPHPQITFLLTITPKHCNMLGNLHGGCAATLIDVLSSIILLGVSEPGLYESGGVSRHLDVTYLRPVPSGVTVRLVSRVVHVGRRLALLRTEILRMEDGAVCVVSDHEKANTDLGGRI